MRPSRLRGRLGRTLRAGASVGIAGVVSLALATGSASANVSHAFSENLTGSGTNTLSSPTDVAIDQTNGDVYVTDPANHRVEKFDSAGNFILMFGKDVDATNSGDVCTAASGHTCQAGTSSSTPGGLVSPTYLAVDNYPGGEGDVYVGDAGDNLVSKYDSSGNLINGWGANGQKDGSDSITVTLSNGESEEGLPGFGPLYGLAVGPKGGLFVGGEKYGPHVLVYKQNGEYRYWTGSNSPWLKVDPLGRIYSASGVQFFTRGQVFMNDQLEPRNFNTYQVTEDWPTLGFALDPKNEELYEAVGTRMEQGTEIHPGRIDHYSADCNPVVAVCEPIDSFGEGHVANPVNESEITSTRTGVAVDGASGTVYVANPGAGAVAVFGDVRPTATTGPPTDVTETGVTMTAHIDPLGRGDIVSCKFEYGFDQTYGHTAPCAPSIPPNYSTATDVSATLSGFSAGTREHYRVVVENTAGATAVGVDETFITTAPPAVDGLLAQNLTAVSAELLGQVNPNGLETTYHFQYGLSTAYGKQVSGTIGAGNSDQQIEASLSELAPHNVYHFRLVAENADGVTATEDHTFNFYPPPCPNENVRQQTEANFLPDCRAYELVSPEDAGGTQLFADGPNTGYASSPSRFSYTGLFSTIPNSGGNPIDGGGDLYVATRTDTGWVNKYVGIPSNEAAVDGGPPMGPPGSTPGAIRNSSQLPANGGSLVGSQNTVITDTGMNTFLDFNDGNQAVESIFGADFQNHTVIASNAPYVWNASGELTGRWPTNLGAVGEGAYNATSFYSHGGGLTEQDRPQTLAPGGVKALDCPYVSERGEGEAAANDCPGDVTASADLGHFVFATEWNLFAPGGNLQAPGSVYDNNTTASTVAVASLTPAGGNIPSEPLDHAGDALQIPSVSSDGSHILMAAGGTGPCGFTTCPVPPCGDDYNATKRCPMQPSHLYMRVDGAMTFDVSQGHDVTYIGSSGDGTKVFFTTQEQLVPQDLDGSTDLYMWSQAGAESGHPLTLVSAGSNAGNAGEPGNSDNCNVSFVNKCGALPYNKSNPYYCENPTGYGGNCMSDNFIAPKTGEIYFYSPEILDGSRGVPDQANLYVYRNGHAQYVTTLAGPPTCWETYTGERCAHIVRMQVSPDGSHMAFITRSEVTQYDNNGHLEMYVYTPATGQLVCASCIPNGEKPDFDVYASEDGRFMADDGRAFFATNDALVHSDTNQAVDVYEYVDGRPQLISPGTGETRQAKSAPFSLAKPGLISVNGNGRDVFFATYDTLVRQDHNGLFLKFYDARTGGGFPAPAPPPPCEAADECHGAGSTSPASIQNETGATLSGGNAAAAAGKKAAQRHHRAKRHHRRHGKSKRRAGA